MNQCDGCRRRMPLDKHGRHYNPLSEWDSIGCTAAKYTGIPLTASVEKHGDMYVVTTEEWGNGSRLGAGRGIVRGEYRDKAKAEELAQTLRTKGIEL